jgi:hypothetical protein
MVAGEMDYWLTVVARDIQDLEHVLTRLATHGGHRVITYLRLKQLKPPSPLPLLPGTLRRRTSSLEAGSAPSKGARPVSKMKKAGGA